LYAKDVVVGREHVERRRGTGRHAGLNLEGNLGVVNTREVARTGRLVLFRLEGERVRVHTRHRAARVVVERLHLVEVLTGLLLEAILAVKDKFEGVERTDSGGRRGTFFDQSETTVGTRGEERDTGRLCERHVAVGFGDGRRVRFDDDITRRNVGGEVPQLVFRGRRTSDSPDEFLHRVVVGQTDVLGITRGHGIDTSVLHLFNEVFVTLLGEASAFFSVEVHVVAPNLEGVGTEVGFEHVRQIEVNAHFVVLKGNERQIKTRIPVEKEDQRQEHLTLTRRHLRVVRLLGFIQVKLRVQTPPALVVLVDALTTDGEFGRLDRTFRNPVAVRGTRLGGETSLRRQFNVHVTDQVTVAGNSHGDATVVSRVTVRGLFDVFHRKVGVSLVHSLEESDLRVTRKVDILSAIGNQLHETASHFESFCTIYKDFFLAWYRTTRKIDVGLFSV